MSNEPSFTYLRYNVELENKHNYHKYHSNKNTRIASALSEFSNKEINSLREMDVGENTEKLLSLGDIFASEEVEESHFPINFSESCYK